MTHLGAYQLEPSPEIQAAARDWPVQWVSRETEDGHHFAAHRGQARTVQAHLVCGECAQSVCCLSPDVTRGSYTVSAAAILAGVTSHIRQCHEGQMTHTGPGR